MILPSLSQSAIGSLALYGLNEATQQIQSSTYRLSSGDRLFRAGDDVAALTISSRLQTQIAGFRQGLQNSTQADSLLQVAYGGLSEISDILDEMRTIAVQANSGSLTANERGLLDLEFQQLRSSIDQIADSTNFNGVSLIDGSVRQDNTITPVNSNGTQASGTLTFTANIGAGQTIELNGVTFTEGVDFNAGGTTADSVSNLADAVSGSSDLAVSGASYQAVGNSLQITQRTGGTLGNQYLIDQASSTASFVTAGASTSIANVFSLQNGADNGFSIGDTSISGTVGDSLVTDLSQTTSETVLNVFGSINDNNELRIDDGNGGTINFRFRNAPANPEDIQIGATTEETLQNAVNVIENYSTTDNFVLNQLEYEVQGNNLIIQGRQPGSVLDLTGAAATVTETVTGGALSNGTLNNGTNAGVNVAGIANADFVGTISGFSASFNAANDITASVTVGDSTYSADITNTQPGADTFVRFNASDGGYFDVEIASGGLAVANQADANTFANRLDAAFSTLNVTQSRLVDNFIGSGQLAGAEARFQSDDFSNVRIDDIEVTAPADASSNFTLDITINDEVFRSTSAGQGIGASETLTLRSLDNADRSLTITNGNTAIDVTDASEANTFEQSLRTNFGLGTGSGALSFQLGPNTSDFLSVSIGSATSDSLFGGADPVVSTQADAADAIAIIDSASDSLGEILAEVGSAQSSLDYASNNINNSIVNLDAARSNLADTDIPFESSQFASALVRQQAAIAVLAQTQLLGSNLLDLLKSN